MESILSFSDIVEAAEQLSLEEQESLLDLLQRRLIERRRGVLAREIEEARREFSEGKSRVMTPSEIIAETILLEKIGTHEEVY